MILAWLSRFNKNTKMSPQSIKIFIFKPLKSRIRKDFSKTGFEPVVKREEVEGSQFDQMSSQLPFWVFFLYKLLNSTGLNITSIITGYNSFKLRIIS